MYSQEIASEQMIMDYVNRMQSQQQQVHHHHPQALSMEMQTHSDQTHNHATVKKTG